MMQWTPLLFLLVGVVAPASAQTVSVWEERRDAEKNKSPYIHRVFEYRPAPGQFINSPGTGDNAAAESIAGGVDGLVSLGGFGGYIIVGFDHKVWNDPDNPYGVDFTVVSNAAANSSEPAAVMVAVDANGNGLPDDAWYELKGSSYDATNTVHRYGITYTRPERQTDGIPWTDSRGESGLINAMPTHTQPYYPLPEYFPGYPQEEVTFSGTLVAPDVDESNPYFIRIRPLPFGYADNKPFNRTIRPYAPDNPATPDITEGSGGDAFDIDWAVDENGIPVRLEGIDFIKIYTAVNVHAGWLGELSAEICGVVDVAPDNVAAVSLPGSQSGVQIYPSPASEYLHIRLTDNRPVTHIEIWNMAGRSVYRSQNAAHLHAVSVREYPEGIYIIRIRDGERWITRKISVRH
ncbi:MAG: T9SS type A sorting domain-containing protein [Bacteroidales bacterium]|jgi:hypothetical protein|nr:T9SS type A sorting domain-containing protein [Bacteroidales bacterium]